MSEKRKKKEEEKGGNLADLDAYTPKKVRALSTEHRGRWTKIDGHRKKLLPKNVLICWWLSNRLYRLTSGNA